MLDKGFRYPTEIKNPTLIISGTLDISTPYELAQSELMPMFENAVHLIIKNAGHYDTWGKQSTTGYINFLTDGSTPENSDLEDFSWDVIGISDYIYLSLLLLITVITLVIWLVVKIVKKRKQKNGK